MTSRADVRSANHVTIKGGKRDPPMTYQGTRRRPYLIMVSAVLLSLGVGIGHGIGSGIGIGFGIFHTPNPFDGMKLSIVENSKVPANQTACVGHYRREFSQINIQ